MGEKTALLRELVQKAKERSPGTSNDSSKPPLIVQPQRTAGASSFPPTMESISGSGAGQAAYPELLRLTLSLSRTIDAAVSDSLHVIQRVREAIDGVRPFSLSTSAVYGGGSGSEASAMQTALELSEAELAAAGQSNQQTLDRVLELKESTPKKSVRSGSPSPSSHSQLLLHVEKILEEQRGVVVNARVEMAMCKEEARLYALEMDFLAGGGLPALQASWGASVKAIKPSGLGKKEETDAYVSGKGTKVSDKSSGAASLHLTQMTRSKELLKGVMNSVSTTVKEKADEALKGEWLREGKPKHHAQKCSEDPAAWLSTPLPPLSYTKEEEEALQAAHQVLETRHRKSFLKDAMEVEVAVRDLTQMSSLVNETILTQREKFSILLSNTAEAHEFTRKAVVELEKPMKAFWNPKRMLIALFWCCAVIVFFMNWLLP